MLSIRKPTFDVLDLIAFISAGPAALTAIAAAAAHASSEPARARARESPLSYSLLLRLRALLTSVATPTPPNPPRSSPPRSPAAPLLATHTRKPMLRPLSRPCALRSAAFAPTHAQPTLRRRARAPSWV
jgi:hypothetical protein